jgi:FkbM family methyltransferase
MKPNLSTYSQNKEQDVILRFFGYDYKGVFLDLGAYDGINLSNTRALVELGWDGLLVEASPKVYVKLIDNCHKRANVSALNVAVSNRDGDMDFFDNENAVGTLHVSETCRWNGEEDFSLTKVKCRNIAKLLDEWYYLKYDFVSIDCEGEDLNILASIDFEKYMVKMVCVEWNGKNKKAYDEIMKGWFLVHKNNENLIYAVRPLPKRKISVIAILRRWARKILTIVKQ